MANKFKGFKFYSKKISVGETNHSLTLPISKANAIAQGYLVDIFSDANEDDEEARKELNTLVSRITSQEEQSGDDNDFHNFAVTLARKDEYTLACKVIECGLRLYPHSVDLLADFLQYGMSCGKYEECKKYYNLLIKIPHVRWPWTGFSFLIKYLDDQPEKNDSDSDIDLKIKELLSLVEEFRKLFPHFEESYISEANVYHNNGRQKEELDVLQKAMTEIKVCPKCALKCADILFDRGDYADAVEAVQRGIEDSTKTQNSVSDGYLRYLSALCNIAVSLKDRKMLKKEEVLSIYSDFNIAVKEYGYQHHYSDVIKSKTNALINKYKINIPTEYENLSDCVL